jgi:Fe-S-cluster containining protein
MSCDGHSRDELTASDIFQCRQCGDCCRGFGGTLMAEADAAAIAEYLGMALEDFLKTHCVRSGSGLVLAQGEDGYCVFARQALCRIHPVKPHMCRAWPFIEGVLRAPENWYIMAGACPGMRTDVSENTVARCVKAALAAAGSVGRDESGGDAGHDRHI